MKSPLLTIGLLMLGAISQADSFIRVINESDHDVMVVWQAGGCAGFVMDPTGDLQFTVCEYLIVEPGDEERYVFNIFKWDRSAKVWGYNNERIGYCNSMDDSSLKIGGDTPETQEVTATSGC